jgi:hypothetical protein
VQKEPRAVREDAIREDRRDRALAMALLVLAVLLAWLAPGFWSLSAVVALVAAVAINRRRIKRLPGGRRSSRRP